MQTRKNPRDMEFAPCSRGFLLLRDIQAQPIGLNDFLIASYVVYPVSSLCPCGRGNNLALFPEEYGQPVIGRVCFAEGADCFQAGDDGPP